MIARPLDLASRLRPEPRNFDWLFYVNGGLIGLFFALFGSQFVLAPGMSIDFLPKAAGASVNAKPTTHAITVLASGLILTSDGPRTPEQLEVSFRSMAKTVKNPVLLVKGEGAVSANVIVKITAQARNAGFQELIWATGGPPEQAGVGDNLK